MAYTFDKIMNFLQKPTKASKKIKAPLAVVWDCLVNPANWIDANRQIIDIRRGVSGALELDENFELDKQYESGDRITTTYLRAISIKPMNHLHLQDERQKLLFDLTERGSYVVVTITSEIPPSFMKFVFRLFGLTEARIIRDSFLECIGRVARRKHKSA